MNFLIRQFKKITQIIVDSVNGKPVDIFAMILYLFTGIFAVRVLYSLYNLIYTPFIENPIDNNLYGVLIILPLFTFFITLAGDKLKKTSTRLSQFIFAIITTSIFGMGYIAQIANTTFVGWLNNIPGIETLPTNMLIGNIRVVTFFFPVILIMPITLMTFKLVKDKTTRETIVDYEVELLLPTVMEMNDVTIDIKICEDAYTGEPCIVPEKKLFESVWLQGSSGSGKTATVLRPILGQLFSKKGYLIQNLKKLSFEALNEGIAVLTQPVSNHWFNKNFSMEYIRPADGKLEEFKKKFGKYIIGIRDNEETVVNEIVDGGILEFDRLQGDSKYLINIKVVKDTIELSEKEIEITQSTTLEYIKLGKFKDVLLTTKEQEKFNEENKIKDDDFNSTSELSKIVTEEKEDNFILKLPKLENGIKYKVFIKKKGSGEIIYRNLGVTVVAPDGGLPEDTVKIGAEHGIKVHKIDPKMSEINKGQIAQFNPLLGDRPAKTADIISSILVSMEQSDGAASKAYFVNASVRAVRNVVILLKVMFPIVEKREPTLNDVRRMLSDFNAVVPYVEQMKRNKKLSRRWESVITYFETSFYPPDTDDKGKVIPGSRFGSQRKKTEEAIGGVINQLDNFLGRQEIQYILCPEDSSKSLNLAEVLSKGQCISIATRMNELGEKLGKAFALFFILSLQNQILSRFSEDENPEIPHFLIIDEFPMYVNDNTKTFFTFARKYKTSTIIAIQNIGQLKTVSDEFGETIFTNTNTKILLPGANVEDRKYWAEFFGSEERFEMQTGVNSTSMFSDNPNYSEQRRGTIQEKKAVSEQKINDLKFKEAFYSFTNFKGRKRIGKGNTDFLHKQKIKKTEIKEYDYEQFNPYSYEKYLLEMDKKKSIINDTTSDNDINSNIIELEDENDVLKVISDEVNYDNREATIEKAINEDTQFDIESGKDIYSLDVNNLSFDDPGYQASNEELNKQLDEDTINADSKLENDNIKNNNELFNIDADELKLENEETIIETTIEDNLNDTTSYKKHENNIETYESLQQEDIKENKKNYDRNTNLFDLGNERKRNKEELSLIHI